MTSMSQFRATTSGEFVRFLLIGLSNMVISFACFIAALFALSGVPAHAAVSQFLSYCAGIAWSFHWNRKWSFRSRRPVADEAPRFISVQIMCLGLSTGLIGIAVDVLSWPATLSWIVVMALITLLNFCSLKLWVFRSRT